MEVSENFSINEANGSYKFILTSLVNQNRFQAVISKIGKLTKENKDEILDDFIEDVWSEFYQNYSHIIINDCYKANEFIKKISKILIDDNL